MEGYGINVLRELKVRDCKSINGIYAYTMGNVDLLRLVASDLL